MQVQGVLLIDTNPPTRYIEEDKRKLGIAAPRWRPHSQALRIGQLKNARYF